jgi:Tail tubular protein
VGFLFILFATQGGYMGLITKLQAINQMLLASGENLVADLEGESGIDTGIAETILDQVSTDYQLRGIAANKYIRKFALKEDGYIKLPTSDSDESGILAIELVSAHYNADGNLITARMLNNANPVRLWNITDDTDVWSSIGGPYYIEFTMKLPWENLETTVQRAIMTTAMRHYQSITQGDDTTDAFLGYQEQLFAIKNKAADVNDKNKNIFASNTLARDGRYRARYLSDPNRFRYWNTRGY